MAVTSGLLRKDKPVQSALNLYTKVWRILFAGLVKRVMLLSSP